MLSLARNGYTADQVKKALHTGRTLSFRYDLLDNQNQLKKRLDNVLDASISYNSLAESKRTGKFTIRDDGSINFLSDRIKPWAMLKMPPTVTASDKVATFSRASVAYKKDGSQVAAGVPRYESGKFGRGVIIEEGTTNLWTNGGWQDGTLTGWNNYTNDATNVQGTRTVISDSKFKYVLELAKTDTTAARLGVTQSKTWASGGATITDSFYFKKFSANAGSFLKMYFDYVRADSTGAYGSGVTIDLVNMRITGTTLGTSKLTDIGGGWFKVEFTTSTSNIVSGSNYFWVDGNAATVQIAWTLKEAKAYATSFVNGTRSAETLTIQTAGVLNPNEGTIEMRFLRSGAWKSWGMAFSSGGNQFHIEYNSAGSFTVYLTGTGRGSFVSSAQVGIWSSLVFSWKNGTFTVYENGVPKLTSTYSGAPVFDSVLYLGSSQNSYQSNWIIDDLRISNKARADAEILAAYNSNAPLPVDQYTTYKMNFEGDLAAKTYIAGGWAEFPLGVLLLTSPKRKAGSTGSILRDVEAYDQLRVLADDSYEDRYTVTAGTNYITAVKTVLDSAGITSNFQNLTATDKTLPADRDWDPDTSKLQIINDLLGAINYRSLWFDEAGIAVAVPYVSPAVRASEYTYRDDQDSVILPGVEHELDLFDIPNKWVVFVSEADRPSLKSVRTNSNPDSPTSTVSRGRNIPKRIQVEAADQASLDAIADRFAFEASQVYEGVDFETGIMPFHSDSDVLTLEYSKLGISAKYAETSWEFQLKAGSSMKHHIRRVVTI